MLKVKTLNTNYVKNYIFEYGENVFSLHGDVLCNVKVMCEKQFTVLKHLKTDKHTIEQHSGQQQKSNNFYLLH